MANKIDLTFCGDKNVLIKECISIEYERYNVTRVEGTSEM